MKKCLAKEDRKRLMIFLGRCLLTAGGTCERCNGCLQFDTLEAVWLLLKRLEEKGKLPGFIHHTNSYEDDKHGVPMDNRISTDLLLDPYSFSRTASYFLSITEQEPMIKPDKLKNCPACKNWWFDRQNSGCNVEDGRMTYTTLTLPRPLTEKCDDFVGFEK